MATAHWTTADMPDLHGRVAVVTGGNSGIGYEAAQELAAKGAHVIIAARNAERGEAVVQQIRQAHPTAQIEFIPLDLASLANIHEFASTFLARFTTLALLINNAGVMGTPYRKTADGFELQFGTNHLGHFTLTGLLLPAILAVPDARIVTVSSMMHKAGVIKFGDLDSTQKYERWEAYGQSKLANLLFAYELQRRLEAAGSTVISVGCHPGYADTNLQSTSARMEGSRIGELIGKIGNRLIAQSSAMGALSTLYAATAPGVHGGDYIGPLGLGNIRGYPGKHPSNPFSYDPVIARQLWEVSEERTGIHYDALQGYQHKQA